MKSQWRLRSSERVKLFLEASLVEIESSTRWIEDVCGGVDLLINNAGVITKGLLLDPKNTVELYRTMETNIIGLCLVTREATRLMKKRDEECGTVGHIVNIK
jgi:NAD(P)-dependent dehydrogenase (short-subunit alcohol dehydrogenase family)